MLYNEFNSNACNNKPSMSIQEAAQAKDGQVSGILVNSSVYKCISLYIGRVSLSFDARLSESITLLQMIWV